MISQLAETASRWHLDGHLLPPLLATLWIAWGDVRTRRIPNYLVLAAALAGLTFQVWSRGWAGLGEGLLGLALGFGLLIIPYLLGGMGAGDVKALAALGAWLGPGQTFSLFIYATMCGGLISLGMLLWQAVIRKKVLTEAALLINAWRLGHFRPTLKMMPKAGSIPYGVAIALGMLILVYRGV